MALYNEALECYMMLYNSSDGSYESYQLPCYPDEVSDATSATWSNQTIVGRSAPIAAYTGTSFRDIGFTFELHREMERTGQYSYTVTKAELDAGITTVDKAIAALRKSVYPQYLAKGLLPPIARFRFGHFVAKGYVAHVGYTWKKPVQNGRYMNCTATVQMYAFADKIVGQDGVSLDPLNPFSQTKSH